MAATILDSNPSIDATQRGEIRAWVESIAASAGVDADLMMGRVHGITMAVGRCANPRAAKYRDVVGAIRHAVTRHGDAAVGLLLGPQLDRVLSFAPMPDARLRLLTIHLLSAGNPHYGTVNAVVGAYARHVSRLAAEGKLYSTPYHVKVDEVIGAGVAALDEDQCAAAERRMAIIARSEVECAGRIRVPAGYDSVLAPEQTHALPLALAPAMRAHAVVRRIRRMVPRLPGMDAADHGRAEDVVFGAARPLLRHLADSGQHRRLARLYAPFRGNCAALAKLYAARGAYNVGRAIAEELVARLLSGVRAGQLARILAACANDDLMSAVDPLARDLLEPLFGDVWRPAASLAAVGRTPHAERLLQWAVKAKIFPRSDAIQLEELADLAVLFGKNFDLLAAHIERCGDVHRAANVVRRAMEAWDRPMPQPWLAFFVRTPSAWVFAPDCEPFAGEKPPRSKSALVTMLHERGYLDGREVALMGQGLSRAAAREALEFAAHTPPAGRKDVPAPNHPRMALLAHDDPVALQIGDLTHCCQHLGGAGEDAAVDTWVRPDVGVWVYKSSGGEIVAQAEVWLSHDRMAIVLDSIEARGGVDKEAVCRAFYESALAVSKQHGVDVYVGATKYGITKAFMKRYAKGKAVKARKLGLVPASGPLEYTDARKVRKVCEVPAEAKRWLREADLEDKWGWAAE